MESRKLLLENTFAIKEVFSNNEATSWAIEELKRRGLKRLVREFYTHLRIDGDQPNSLFSSIDGKEVEVTIGDIAAVLKCSHESPESDIPWIECPSMLTLEDIVSDMCEGQYAVEHRNVASKTKIPRNLLFIDMVLYRNVSPLGHKTQRRDLFLSALYSFHRGFWCSIPEIIWRQIQKFCEGVHHRGAEHTKTWGLPFPFLITHILRKIGIRGTLADEPITESPHFGSIQWRQSLSHMPRAALEPAPEPAPEPEPMDIPEMAAELEREQSRRSSQRSTRRSTRMRSISRSHAQIFYTSRTPSWTYDPRLGTYDFILQICIGMFVRTDSRSRRCSEPSWTDCLQRQDLMHHH
jgi:hypothetical protein